MGQQDFIIYKTADGKISVALYADNGELWLNQNQLAELFATSKQNISLHALNILKEKELEENSVVKDFLTTAADGKKYSVSHYTLPMILAIGFRVKGIRGTQFRQWANLHLQEYINKGFIMDDDRLKNPNGRPDYFDDGIPFVRVSNISQFEVSEEKYISESLYKSLTPQEQNTPFEKSKNHQPKQGEILFSKDGSPGIACHIQDQPAKMIPSVGILRLKSKTNQVNNEYLTLVLISILVQELISRDVGGSIILHWRPDQVKETVIPILSKEKQTQILQKVTESFALRKKSKHLLESAKNAVEMAIEQDEQTAMDWLELQTKDCQLDNE